MTKGRFITLEGGEGVGKSTLARNIQESLTEKGIESILTREPGGSLGGESIRAMVLNPPKDVTWSPLTQTLLFFAARRDHLENTILPAINRGDWVICDRFTDSTRAYQAVGGDVDEKTVETLDQLVVGSQQPDLTLVLDMTLEGAALRRKERNGPIDAFESLPQGFHEKVRQAFSAIAKEHSDRCVILDASKDAEIVSRSAISILEQRFGLI